MLISLHLPKTAGTSFLALLEAYFGASLLRDYADRPINRGAFERRLRALGRAVRQAVPERRLRGIQCIHGHFLPLKYAPLARRCGGRYVVWLRDPVERLASHYHYWQRSYEPAQAGRLHRRVVEEDWTLERFCLAPELRNLYSAFLWGFPLRRFDFIGITEYYDDDVRAFARRFLGDAPAMPVACNRNRARGHGSPPSPYIDDPAFRAHIEAYHARDVALYRQALAARAARPGQ